MELGIFLFNCACFDPFKEMEEIFFSLCRLSQFKQVSQPISARLWLSHPDAPTLQCIPEHTCCKECRRLHPTKCPSKKNKNKLAFIPFSVNHHSLSSLPQTFSSLILPVSEEGRREEGSGRRDSSLTCFPGPCPRLCSPLIGKSGCGTHSSSTSGFIPGFYQRLDKKLHYRQSLKTLDARERHCMDDLILDIKDFFFFVLRGCQTVPLTECGKSGIGKLIR